MQRTPSRPTPRSTMGTGSFFFLGVKRPGRSVDHPPPSRAEVKERVKRYLHLTPVPNWHGTGQPSPPSNLYFCSNNIYDVRYFRCIQLAILAAYGLKTSRKKKPVDRPACIITLVLEQFPISIQSSNHYVHISVSCDNHVIRSTSDNSALVGTGHAVRSGTQHLAEAEQPEALHSTRGEHFHGRIRISQQSGKNCE